MSDKITKLLERIFKRIKHLFCATSGDLKMTKERSDKKDLMREHTEAARGLAELNNPKTPQEILMRQTIADYTKSNQRVKERERFFRE